MSVGGSCVRDDYVVARLGEMPVVVSCGRDDYVVARLRLVPVVGVAHDHAVDRRTGVISLRETGVILASEQSRTDPPKPALSSFG
jgi:hypothetical protein